ncbi:MAG: hypothetical protein MZV49_13705 [Rhodopseudomonas palustris]|nr:hypothetical protein [Rhodopseudomonas palustris]
MVIGEQDQHDLGAGKGGSVPGDVPGLVLAQESPWAGAVTSPALRAKEDNISSRTKTNAAKGFIFSSSGTQSIHSCAVAKVTE